MSISTKEPRRRPDADWVRQRIAARGGQPRPATLRPAPADRFEPFPMTDMQEAYWLGRSQGLAGNAAIRAYVEFDGPRLDPARLERAWNRVLQRHDMLRALVLADGRQQVLATVPFQAIPVSDHSAADAETRAAALLATRSRMLETLRPLDQWPQSTLHYSIIDETSGRLHLNLDAWCFDGRSFQIIIEDFAAFYANPDAALPEPEVTFRDYVLALRAREAEPAFAKALAWWQERLTRLPPPPPLPYARMPKPGENLVYRRFSATLTKEETASLKRRAADHGASIPAVLAAVYSQVLALFSGERHFTLNVPRFNRPDWHPDLNDLVGEFASFSLLEIELPPGLPMAELIGRIQRQLWTDLEHAEVSGVRLLRELARLRGGLEAGAMPIVLSTMPDRRSSDKTALERAFNRFGEVGYNLTSTPQVWLDCHYFEFEDAFGLGWDTTPALFPDGMLDEMFELFADLLRRLATLPESWTDTRPLRVAPPPAEPVSLPSAAGHLLAPLAGLAREAPDLPAILDGAHVVTRGMLDRSMGALARRLRGLGVVPGDIVALHEGPGRAQVMAALGIIGMGAVYMPLDTTSPPKRLAEMVRHARPKLILSNDWPADDAGIPAAGLDALLAAPEPQDRWQPPAEPSAETPACVIHTSGSTGRPKGVVLAWGSLAYIIRYSNERFGLGPDDRALMLTSYHHDLALFDLLGPLTAGGAVVTLTAERALDPAYWRQQATAHGVTFLNCVPRLAEILAGDYERDLAAARPPLRQAVLGGDWIPLDLPERLRALWPAIAVTTIGGPTETTIWNIMHDVEPGRRYAASIPYGRPIPGCGYRILDRHDQDCPVWAPGEMVCGGISLAIGYLNDPAETERRFFIDAESGERFYRTGDRGRRLPDGTIEILGRVDFQLNIGGYRADPASIEAVINRAPQVRDCAVVEHGEGERRRLAAFVTARDAADPPSGARLVQLCQEHLPPALVPKQWVVLERLPLSTTGKVDRQALMRWEIAAEPVEPTAERTPLEELILTIWSEVLGSEIDSVSANFFAAGGDSISATRVILRVEEAIGIKPGIAEFFATPTARGLAEHILDQLVEPAD